MKKSKKPTRDHSVGPVQIERGSSDLRGKLALVTGGTQGIGFAIAQALTSEGCELILCGRNEARLARAKKELSHGNARLLAIRCDVADEASVRRMFAIVKKESRALDVLINCAGIAHPFKSIAELSLSEWSDTIAANLTGTFLVTKSALPLMSRGASIVNVLSMSSKRAFANLAAYNASKFGALGFTNTLREELRPRGIRVIGVLPGATDTPIWNALWPDAPRQKMMRPEAVAQAVVGALKLSPESTVEELDLMPTLGAL